LLLYYRNCTKMESITRYMHNRILTKNLSAIFLIQFDPSESQKQFLYLWNHGMLDQTIFPFQ
jgi:hypothetical protein